MRIFGKTSTFVASCIALVMGIGLVENVVMRSRQHDLQQRTSPSRIMQLRRE